MNRGVSSGGGQSSLGYLFGSGEGKQRRDPPSPSKVTINPPYGIDAEEEEKMPTKPLAKQNTSNSSHQTAQGQNSGKFVTVSKLMVKE